MKKVLLLALLALPFSKTFAQCGELSPGFAQQLAIVGPMSEESRENLLTNVDDTVLAPGACDAILQLIASVQTENDFLFLGDTLKMLCDNFELGYVLATSIEHESCDMKIEEAYMSCPFMVKAFDFVNTETRLEFKDNGMRMCLKKKLHEYSNYQKAMLIALLSSEDNIQKTVFLEKSEVDAAFKQLNDSRCQPYINFAGLLQELYANSKSLAVRN